MRRPHTASEARAQLIKGNKAYKYIDECRGSMLREIFANAYKELDKDYRRNCDPSSMYEILDRDVLDGHTLETVIDVMKIQHRISVPFINLCMLIAKIMVDCGDDDADAFLSQAHSDIMYMSRNKLFDLDEQGVEYEEAIERLSLIRDCERGNYWRVSSTLMAYIRTDKYGECNKPSIIKSLMPRFQLACMNDDIDEIHAIIDDRSRDEEEPEGMYHLIRCAFEYFYGHGYLNDAMNIRQRLCNLYDACSDTLYDIDKVVFKVDEYEYRVALSDATTANQIYDALMEELKTKHQTKCIDRINRAHRKIMPIS